MTNAQERFSTAGFVTLPYAGQECAERQALKSTVATASSASTLVSFFIVGPFGLIGRVSDKCNRWYHRTRQNVSTIGSSIFPSHGYGFTTGERGTPARYWTRLVRAAERRVRVLLVR
mgnify:CR=1 FL=1